MPTAPLARGRPRAMSPTGANNGQGARPQCREQSLPPVASVSASLVARPSVPSSSGPGPLDGQTIKRPARWPTNPKRPRTTVRVPAVALCPCAVVATPRRPRLFAPRLPLAMPLRHVASVAALLCAATAAATAVGAAADVATPSDCDVAVIGAGIGGLYTAWRLLTGGSGGGGVAPKVCIFEASARTGGRILTLRGADALPQGFDGYTVDMGAYRWHRRRHALTRMLADGPLNVTSTCYTDPLGRDETCGAEDRVLVTARGRAFFSTPNASVDEQLATWAPGLIPYAIPPAGRWGVNASAGGRAAATGPRSPRDWLIGPDTAVPEIAARWADLDGARDYAAAMAVVDEILEALRTSPTGYRGTPYTQVSVLQIARDGGYAEEELAALLDMGNSVGDAKWYQTPLSDYARVQLRNVALERWTFPSADEPTGMVNPVDPATGRRAGMATVLDRLAEAVTAAGGRLVFGHRAIFLGRPSDQNGTDVTVSFANGRSVTVRRVIVNAGKADVAAWGVASLPITGASAEFRTALDAVYVAPSSKMYCWWADAWWLTKLGRTRGRARMEAPLFSLRYHDGSVTCEDPERLTGCRGALLVSYVLGDATGVRQSIWSHGFSAVPFSPLSGAPDNAVDRFTRAEARNDTGGRRGLLWDATLTALRASHAGVAAASGMTPSELVPEPEACASAVWWDVGVHALSAYARGAPGRDWLRTFAAPAPGVHLVNEAWGEDRGWAEASLRSAERVLYHHFGVGRPAWMEAVFHKSVVERWNAGTRA